MHGTAMKITYEVPCGFLVYLNRLPYFVTTARDDFSAAIKYFLISYELISNS
jgi:hypothetical protein